MSQAMERGGIYRIEVRGALEESVVHALGGVRVTARMEADGPLILLDGRLADQAALVGLLQALLQHDLSLVSMRLFEDQA